MYNYTVATISCPRFYMLQYVSAQRFHTNTRQPSHLVVLTTDTIQVYISYHADDSHRLLIYCHKAAQTLSSYTTNFNMAHTASFHH